MWIVLGVLLSVVGWQAGGDAATAEATVVPFRFCAESLALERPDWSADLLDVAFVDVEGDGDLDLVRLVNWQPSGHGGGDRRSADVRVSLNDGAGQLSEAGSFRFVHADGSAWDEPARPLAHAFDWADCDGDGDSDVVLDGTGRRSPVYRNDGALGLVEVSLERDAQARPRFPEWHPSGGNSFSRWVGAGDDLALRVVMPSLREPHGRLNVFSDWQAADGPSHQDGLLPGEPWPWLRGNADLNLGWVDHDDDGDLDVWVALRRWDAGPSLFLVEDVGALSFEDLSSTTLDVNVRSLETSDCAWADFDADGRLDVFVASYGVYWGGAQPDRDVLLRQGADHRLIESSETFAGAAPRVNAWRCEPADFDLDGDLDVFVLSAVNTWSYVASNDGAGRFEALGTRQLGAGHVEGSHLAVGDLDADGDVDVFVERGRDLAGTYSASGLLLVNETRAPPPPPEAGDGR